MQRPKTLVRLTIVFLAKEIQRPPVTESPMTPHTGLNIRRRHANFRRHHYLYLHLIIMQAGDIESNPGPYCEAPVCKKKIYSGNPLTCHYDGCNLQCHEQFKCSGIKRRTKNVNWFCTTHRPDDFLAEVPENYICSVCKDNNKKLKRYCKHLTCAEDTCDLKCHVGPGCSGISIKIKDPIWLCPEHISHPPQNIKKKLDHQNALGSKCCVCFDTVPRGQSITCSKCDNICHIKEMCSHVRRSNNENRFNNWSCTNHGQESDANKQQNTCDECGIRIQITSTPKKCDGTDCDKVCHPYVTCSGIPQYNTTLKWKCGQHRDGITPERCSFCDKLHKAKDTPLKCKECPRTCHRKPKCSGIKGNIVDPSWLCSMHAPPSSPIQQPHPIPQPTLPACFGCKREFTAAS